MAVKTFTVSIILTILLNFTHSTQQTLGAKLLTEPDSHLPSPSSQNSPPPIWPQHFTIEFTQANIPTSQFSSGKFFYNYPTNQRRYDLNNGVVNVLCANLNPTNLSSACTMLNTNNSMYVVFPHEQKCCRCCSDQAEVCAVEKPDWLKEAQYQGEWRIDGEMYDWWNLGELMYYAAKDEKQTLRRAVLRGVTETDYLMNTFNTDNVDPKAFELPTYCRADCPQTSLCSKFGQKQKPE